MMKRREFLVASAMLGADFALQGAEKGLRVDIWHGRHRRIGQLGDVQDDFNVLGHIYSANPISSVTCSVNRSAPKPLWFTASRRIVRYGDFNADIPLAFLRAGDNRIVIEATDTEGAVGGADLIVTPKLTGERTLREE